MCIVMPVVSAVVLVFFGYVALWSASQSNVPAGVAKFGRIMAILLYACAGLALIGSLSMRQPCGGPGMGMKGYRGAGENMGGKNMPCMQGQMNAQRPGARGAEMRSMDKMDLPCEAEQGGAPAPVPQEGKVKH